MNNLQTFKNEDGIEIIVDTVTGESFCSIKGYARMSGISAPGIMYRVDKLKTTQFEGVQSSLIKTAKVKTAGGVQGVQLITEDIIVEWLPKDNPKMASAMMKLGVRMFLHQQAGYSVTSTAIEPKQELSRLEILEMAIASEKENLALKAKIEADKDKVALAEAVGNASNLETLGKYLANHKLDGKNIGRNTGFKMLREMKVIKLSDCVPYQKYVSQGYFEVKQKETLNRAGMRVDSVTLVTAKGKEFVTKKLIEYHQQRQIEAAMEIVAFTE